MRKILTAIAVAIGTVALGACVPGGSPSDAGCALVREAFRVGGGGTYHQSPNEDGGYWILSGGYVVPSPHEDTCFL